MLAGYTTFFTINVNVFMVGYIEQFDILIRMFVFTAYQMTNTAVYSHKMNLTYDTCRTLVIRVNLK